MKPHLSVIIPVYNLSENPRPSSLEEVKKYLSNAKFTWEVILVDDGSSDNTNEFIKDFASHSSGFQAISIAHGGKVAAVAAGIQIAKGEIILFTDFDQSTPLAEFEKFNVNFKLGADIVIAERIRAKQNDSFISKFRSVAFNFLVRALVLPSIPDSQCGFKAFKNNVGKYLFANLNICRPKPINGPYMGAFDVEILLLASLKGFKIRSIPVSWRRESSKNLKIDEPLKMLTEIIKIKLYYGGWPKNTNTAI